MEYLKPVRARIILLETKILARQEKVARFREAAMATSIAAIPPTVKMMVKTDDGKESKIDVATYPYGISSQPDVRGLENDVLGYAAICEEINALTVEWSTLQAEVSSNICAHVVDDRLREVLHQRYVMARCWDDIAESLGMTTRHVLRVHREAAREFESSFCEKKDENVT